MSRQLIQFSHLFKSFGPLVLFEDISLSIHEGEVFALIGENGSGKTTLLQFLIGTLMPDSGIFSRAPHLTVGFLPQEISFEKGMSAKAYIEEGPLCSLDREMAVCLENGQLAKWAELHGRYEQMGGYGREPIEKALKGLKIESAVLNSSMAELSSGQRIRIALAKAFVENPDLLLLDEPTNHLDKEMISYLKEALYSRKGSTIIVSHDRKFLNDTCNRLVEIKNKKLISYGGNYDFYLEEQKSLLERQMKAYEAQLEERLLLKQKIKALTFSKKEGRLPKDGDKMGYNYRGENHQKSLKHNLDNLKARLFEIEKNPLPHPKPKTIKGLRFFSEPLNSHVAIQLENLSKAFNEKILFSDFNKTLFSGDRIVLTGENGSGKTTLLKSILGLVPLDKGEIKIARGAKIAYLDQEVELLPMEQTPLSYFESRFSLTEENLRCELHKAALGGEELLHRPFSTLSVGQRKRLMLLSLLLEKPNVLLLDEPTNHLDLLTIEELEKALLNFEGAILAISHDETFIEKIATEKWAF